MPKSIVAASSVATSGATRGSTASATAGTTAQRVAQRAEVNAGSPIAQAIRFGRMLFVSGVGGVDGGTDTVVAGGLEAQCVLALANLDAILAAAGANHAHVVNLRIVLRDIADAPRLDALLSRWLGEEKVAALCIGGVPNRTGIDLQIDCIAMFDEQRAGQS